MKSILTSALLLSSLAMAQSDLAFTNSHKRVLSTLDVLRFLYSKVEIEPAYAVCNTDRAGVLIVSGSISPTEAKPIVDKPEEDYFHWYQDCLRTFLLKFSGEFDYFYRLSPLTYNNKIPSQAEIDLVLNSLNSKMEKTFPPNLLKYMSSKYPAPTSPYIVNDQKLDTRVLKYSTNYLLSHDWNELPLELKKELALMLLRKYIGPDTMLKSLRYIGADSIYPGKPQTTEQLIEFLLQTVPAKKRLSDAYEIMSFQILVNPYLLEN